LNEVVRAIGLFAIAGLTEIGGGWLMWQCLRE
jgi:drug/metabolite transporter superfamily protein YnfA